jgi:hypothetical protein
VEDLRSGVERVAEDVAYTAIGLAVLGFQRAQVARRQLERALPVSGALERLRSLLSPQPEPPRRDRQ